MGVKGRNLNERPLLAVEPASTIATFDNFHFKAASFFPSFYGV
jgi:hypothetical protein